MAKGVRRFGGMMKTVMTMPDFTVELINNQTKMERLIDRLAAPSVIALDIETVNWWNRHQERIALVQIAFRAGRQPKVAVIDALAELDSDRCVCL